MRAAELRTLVEACRAGSDVECWRLANAVLATPVLIEALALVERIGAAHASDDDWGYDLDESYDDLYALAKRVHEARGT